MFELFQGEGTRLFGGFFTDERMHANRFSGLFGIAPGIEEFAGEDQNAELSHNHAEQTQRFVVFQQAVHEL